MCACCALPRMVHAGSHGIVAGREVRVAPWGSAKSDAATVDEKCVSVSVDVPSEAYARMPASVAQYFEVTPPFTYERQVDGWDANVAVDVVMVTPAVFAAISDCRLESLGMTVLALKAFSIEVSGFVPVSTVHI